MLGDILHAYANYRYLISSPDDAYSLYFQRDVIDTINMCNKSKVRKIEFFDCNFHEKIFEIAWDSFKNRGKPKEFEEWETLSAILKYLNRKYLQQRNNGDNEIRKIFQKKKLCRHRDLNGKLCNKPVPPGLQYCEEHCSKNRNATNQRLRLKKKKLETK